MTAFERLIVFYASAILAAGVMAAGVFVSAWFAAGVVLLGCLVAFATTAVITSDPRPAVEVAKPEEGDREGMSRRDIARLTRQVED
jgi:hypothetical protein